MSVTSWARGLKSLAQVSFGKHGRKRPASRKLLLEALEERTVPTSPSLFAQ